MFRKGGVMLVRFFIVLILVVMLCSLGFAGSVSGTIYYSGSMRGTIFVAVGSNPSDLTSGRYTTISAPGPYTITGDFVDTVDYFALATMLYGFSPVSGEPAGMYPRPFRTHGGVATGINITLAEEGSFGGHIYYSGPVEDIRINIYDAYPLIVGGDPILERTLPVPSLDYRFDHIPAGPKQVKAFIDVNRNDVLDSGEIFADAETPMEGFVFVGGGIVMDSVNFRFGMGIDDFSQKPSILKISSPYPNPFNASVNIPYKVECPSFANVTVFDLQGKPVAELYEGFLDETKGVIHWSPQNLHSGVYLVRFTAQGVSKTVRIIFIK